MKKTWYIKIRGKQKGPYSLEQLKRNREVTPDTLVWIPELKDWVPMRNVPELKEVFKDPGHSEDEEDENGEIGDFYKKGKKLSPELVLEFQHTPPFTFWFFIVLTAIALILLHILNDR